MKRRLFAACAGLALTAVTLPAAAQPSGNAQVYFLRYAREVADGRAVVSTSQDTVVARIRHGDRSLMLQDAQAGAITVERSGRTVAAPLVNTTRVDASNAYDYAERRVSGSGEVPDIFNRYLRPLLSQGPALGQDGQWQVATTLSALGLGSDAAPVLIRLHRTYLANARRPVVLIEFEIPAFAYRAPDGQQVVHWAHGFAVADPDFAEIYALGTQHRAAVTGASGAVRPISIRTSLHGIDPAGGWRMSFAGAPAVRAAVDRTLATSGDRTQIVTAVSDTAPARPYAASVAARLDLAAFALGENGANPLPTVLGSGGAFGSPDSYGPGAVYSPPESSPPESEAERLRRLAEEERIEGNGEASGSGPSSTQLHRVRVRRNGETLTDTSAPLETPEPVGPRQQMLDGINPPLNNDYLQMPLNPEYGLDSYVQRSPASGGFMAQSILYAGGLGGPVTVTDTPTERRVVVDRRLLLRSTHGQSDLIRAAEQYGVDPAAPAADPLSPRNQMLQGLSRYVQNDYQQMRLNPDDGNSTYRQPPAREVDGGGGANQDGAQGGNQGGGSETQRLDAVVSQMAREAEAERQRNERLRTVPVTDNQDTSPPPWMQEEQRRDPTRVADDTDYRLLMAETERALAEARRDERRRQQREASGIDSLDAFVENNAFTYTSMVGVVPTDLSRWGDWLATQNVRELERLALLVGYPNLASALADARNLIRYAEDPGYRRWAMQPPSCGGTIGCGPSYLERWWMRQATVLLGDILADSRDIFSSGGFSDIGISGLNLSYLLRDNALQDGDIVRVRISQFGRTLYQGEINLTNAGETFGHLLRPGVASLEIFAVNEGFSPPNTAEIALDNVVRGEGTQSYSLSTGETATLRIETNARAQ